MWSTRSAARPLLLMLTLLLGGCAVPGSDSPPRRTVVTLGDSVAAGSACDCEPFPDLYAHSQRAASANLAVPGFTSGDVLAQLPGDRTALAAADEVLLMIGANDLAAAFDAGDPYSDAATTVRNQVMATITEIEQIHPTRVIVLGYWNVVQDGQVGRAAYGEAGMRESARATAAANDALRAAAKGTGAIYVSTDVAFHGADGTLDPTALLAADGDHPDAAGHELIAKLIPPMAQPSPRAPSNG